MKKILFKVVFVLLLLQGCTTPIEKMDREIDSIWELELDENDSILIYGD